MNNLIVTKSNAIVEASYKLTLNEQRILLSCISKIDSRSELSPDTEFIVDIKSFSETFGVSETSAYSLIKEGAKALRKRSFNVLENGEWSEDLNWTSKVKYHKKEGQIGIHFGHHAIPYISNLSKSFTSYRLNNIVNMTSVYSIRLYEMLLQWRKIGKVTFTMESFREALGIEKSEYKRMFDFKRKVLNLAVNQINENTDINCNYLEVKKGRKITALEFHFGKYQATQMELEETIKEIQALKGRPE